jgi:hypothetical protein
MKTAPTGEEAPVSDVIGSGARKRPGRHALVVDQEDLVGGRGASVGILAPTAKHPVSGLGVTVGVNGKNVNELRLGFSNTTRNPEGMLSHPLHKHTHKTLNAREWACHGGDGKSVTAGSWMRNRRHSSALYSPPRPRGMGMRHRPRSSARERKGREGHATDKRPPNYCVVPL